MPVRDDGDPAAELMKVRELLAELYPTVAASCIVVDDAGMQRSRIEFSAASSTNWNAIIREAVHQQKLSALLRIALSNYPDHPALHAAVETLSSQLLKGETPPRSGNIGAGTTQRRRIESRVPRAAIAILLLSAAVTITVFSITVLWSDQRTPRTHDEDPVLSAVPALPSDLRSSPSLTDPELNDRILRAIEAGQFDRARRMLSMLPSDSPEFPDLNRHLDAAMVRALLRAERLLEAGAECVEVVRQLDPVFDRDPNDVRAGTLLKRCQKRNRKKHDESPSTRDGIPETP